MADRLAIGLTKSVVVGAITKIQSAIDEEARLRQKVKRDLVYITLEFEMMHSFLDDANEEMKNNLVRTWVKHIQQLAYDVEDCVENVVHLDDKPIFWRRLLPSWMAPPLPLDLAVEELEQLKCRVEDVNSCYRRYNLINDSAGSSKPAVVIHQRLPPVPGASDMLSKARDATKRQHHTFGDLVPLMNKREDNLQVISLWGAAGNHGTTSIIRATFTHQQVRQDFADRAWVKLMHPFNPHGFIRSLMAQFYANSCEEENAATGGMHVLTKMEASTEDLFKEFKQLITEKRYLVVLEGLSTMVDWDAIRTFLPNTKNGSCIIVSTQQSEIASLCLGNFYDILELKKYSDDHSVCALFKEAGQSSSSGKRREAEQWMEDEQPLIGRESQLKELRKYVSEARFSNSKVVSVWGMAGIGKSSLVRRLYYEGMLHSNQFEKFTWVDVSRPFDLRSFYRSLLLDFYSEKDPIQECGHLLTEYRCLVVIDDIRSKEEWDLIQTALVSSPSRSVIIVITSEASIAAYCTNNEDLMLNVQCLEADATNELFRTEVLKKNQLFPLSNHPEGELQDLILKCGGIPRVIANMAGLLVTVRKTGKWTDAVRSLNRRFMHHLETDPEFHSLESLFHWMHSIILNPPDFLKPCIFYLTIFPQDCHIRRRRLLRRWIAEGYSKESGERHAEENAENFFSELVQLSIFKKVDATASTGMGFYLLNGLIREYIISNRMEESLVLELGGRFAVTTQSRGRHLVILTSWERDNIVYKTIDFSRLWSLTVFGKWEPFFISESMKLLRVLDLEDASGVEDADIDKMVKVLRHLKFLSLRGCREICHLPCSLGDLRDLQTLDVRDTSIVTLPASTTKLKKLQYIRAGRARVVLTSTPPAIVSSSSCLPHLYCSRRRKGVKVPGGIEKLKALHTIGVINIAASAGGAAFLKDPKKLIQLRKLGVSGINAHNSKEFVSAMSGHDHLESLSLWLDENSQGCLDDIYLPQEHLCSLKLHGLGDGLPASIKHLNILRKLDLEMGTVNQSDIELLAKLSELCILRLRVKQQLQDGKLHFYAEMYGEQLATFEKVKILEIACSSSDLHVTFGSKSMKNLELLKLDYSSASYELAGLNNLSELKQVLLKGTDDEYFRTQFANALANHPKRPAVKLEELPRSS